MLRRATNLLVDIAGLFGLLFRFPIGVLGGMVQLFILSSLIVKGQTCAVAAAVDDIDVARFKVGLHKCYTILLVS